MSNIKKVTATELEDFDDVEVVEVLVSPGSEVVENQSLIVLESEKAMMEFPSPDAGVIEQVVVKVGDKIRQGDEIVTLRIEESRRQDNDQDDITIDEQKPEEPDKEINDNYQTEKINTKTNHQDDLEADKVYASPGVRKYAREHGVDLQEVNGSADMGRILQSDVKEHIKQKMSWNSDPGFTTGKHIQDFSEFGKVEEKKLNKLKQTSARHLLNAWSQIPHVTQFDEADITELEDARKNLKQSVMEQGVKLTLLPFITKALVKCLQEFPEFNSSVNHDVTALIRKDYYNIGIAVDTPRGLVVPVIEHADRKKIIDLAKEIEQISELARNNELTSRQMQGGCMTISNTGAIGGQHFTPIINHPEVAILGVSRFHGKLVKVENSIVERLILPLSLSYDHRAVDGVAAVKFITRLKSYLEDVWDLIV